MPILLHSLLLVFLVDCVILSHKNHWCFQLKNHLGLLKKVKTLHFELFKGLRMGFGGRALAYCNPGSWVLSIGIGCVSFPWNSQANRQVWGRGGLGASPATGKLPTG